MATNNTDASADPAKNRARAINLSTIQTPASVRVFTKWTPDMLRAAEYIAESGYMYQAATICEWLLTDERVAGVLDTRIDQVIGIDPVFEEGAGRKRKAALKAADAEDDFSESCPESELRRMLGWGHLLGACLHVNRWTKRPDHGGRLLPMPRFWHPQTMRWDVLTQRLTVRALDGEEILVTPGDGRWVFHTPFGFERFWANGIWRSLSRWVLLKQYAMGDWARHGAQGSKQVATCPEGGTEEQRKQLASDLANSGADAAIAMPMGWDLKLLALSANSESIYKQQIEMANEAIAIRIRGGNLTTSVQGGSLAATQAQAKTGDAPKAKFDSASLSTTINQQVMTPWAIYNYGDPRLAPWPLWPTEPNEDKSQSATMVFTLGQGLALFDKLGYAIDEKALKEKYGLDFLGDRTKPEPPPAPPPGAPVPPGGDAPPPAPPANQGGGKDKGAAKNQVRPQAMLSTRSGVPVEADSGFVNGQLYADDVVDDATGKAGQGMHGFVQGLLEVVMSAKPGDWADLRQRVLARYGESASPERLREVLQHAMVLADMSGRTAVEQDADSAG